MKYPKHYSGLTIKEKEERCKNRIIDTSYCETNSCKDCEYYVSAKEREEAKEGDGE